MEPNLDVTGISCLCHTIVPSSIPCSFFILHFKLLVFSISIAIYFSSSTWNFQAKEKKGKNPLFSPLFLDFKMYYHNPKTFKPPQILEFDEKQRPLLGDYIGVESCLDLKKNDDSFLPSILPTLKNQRKCDSRIKKKKEFPPPIPSCRMPWVLKRYYTSDGRLILKEEKVHHKYFQAHRSNGRLTLQLVPLDSSDHEEDQEQELEVQENLENQVQKNQEQADQENQEQEVQDNQELEVQRNQEEEKEESEEENEDGVGYFNNCVENGIGGNVSSPFNKCLNYHSITPGSTCMFGVPVVVPTTRPIHS